MGCHSEERSDEESLFELPPGDAFTRREIPLFARDDSARMIEANGQVVAKHQRRARCIVPLQNHPCITASPEAQRMWSAGACSRCIRARLASPDPRRRQTRGARPDKPARQTAAASRRTPQDAWQAVTHSRTAARRQAPAAPFASGFVGAQSAAADARCACLARCKPSSVFRHSPVIPRSAATRNLSPRHRPATLSHEERSLAPLGMTACG
jgi:hypothetical protein